MRLISRVRLNFFIIAVVIILIVVLSCLLIFKMDNNKDFAEIIHLFIFSLGIVVVTLVLSYLFTATSIKSSVIEPLKMSGTSFDKIMINFERIKNKVISQDNEINKSNSLTNDLKNFIVDVINLIISQAAAITESSASIEEMSSSINNIAKISEGKLSMVSELDKIAYPCENKTEETIGIIKKVSDSMIEMNNAMMELAVGSNEIMGSLEILLKTTDNVKKNFGEMDNKIANITAKLDNLSMVSFETKKGIVEIERAIKDFFSWFMNISKKIC